MWSISALRNAVPGNPGQVYKALLISVVVYYLLQWLPGTLSSNPEFKQQVELAVSAGVAFAIDQAYLWYVRFKTLRKQKQKPNENV